MKHVRNAVLLLCLSVPQLASGQSEPATAAPTPVAIAPTAPDASATATSTPSEEAAKLLSEAVYRVNLGRADDVKLLIEQGVSPNSKDENGVPLLSLAAARVDKEGINVVKALIEAGADINSKDKESQSALFYAARRGNRDVVTLLLENKINYYSVDYTGNIARTIAFREGHTDIVKLMDDFVKAETDKITEQYRALSKALEEQYKAQEQQQKQAADSAAAAALEESRKTAELIEKQKLEQEQQFDQLRAQQEKEEKERQGKWALLSSSRRSSGSHLTPARFNTGPIAAMRGRPPSCSQMRSKALSARIRIRLSFSGICSKKTLKPAESTLTILLPAPSAPCLTSWMPCPPTHTVFSKVCAA